MKIREKFNLLECISEYNWDNDVLNICIENYSVHDFMKFTKQYINFENERDVSQRPFFFAKLNKSIIKHHNL